ncbi:hypothetical protein CSB93_4911 [Pseudomonas paraeruginosa]|uniref:Uncharacterized protein n=3 Tax=Pseudomonas TaxID=286 RepID=A0A2R3INU9_9PSED|nr:hypothetical protein CSB93_4911 [Pseudomonas paraeruginosa]AWE91364.1 hypothetical protein CSC28_3701 [Pseudomonas paraeruginosa]PTC35939.1 hypothetical protein CLJ1_3424 [Pseudomonas aeruginosa]
MTEPLRLIDHPAQPVARRTTWAMPAFDRKRRRADERSGRTPERSPRCHIEGLCLDSSVLYPSGLSPRGPGLRLIHASVRKGGRRRGCRADRRARHTVASHSVEPWRGAGCHPDNKKGRQAMLNEQPKRWRQASLIVFATTVILILPNLNSLIR